MSLFKQITVESTPEEVKKKKLAAKRRAKAGGVVISLINLAVGLVMFFPIFFVISGGFKLDADFTSIPPVFFPAPDRLQLSYYHIALFQFPVQMFGDNSLIFKIIPSAMSWTIPRIPRFMINSFVTSIIGTFMNMLLGTLAAFAFAFIPFKGKKVLFFIILGTMMIPGDTLLIANFITITRLHMIDTYLGIMIVGFVSAQNTFMLRQNFLTVSSSLREASMIDGCGNFRFYTNICIPVSMPIIASLSMSSFVGKWNAYLWPLLVTNNEYMRTVQVGVTQLTFEDTGSQAPLFASLAITLIPTIFIFLFFQRKLVRGITAGSTTG